MDKLFNAKDINPKIRRLIQKKAQRLVGTAGFTEDDVRDILQDLNLYLLTHPFEFDERKGRLTTVIRRIVDNQITTMIEARFAAKRDVRRCQVSLDGRLDARGEETLTGHDVYDMDTYLRRTGRASRSQEELRDLAIDVTLVLEALPPPLKEIAELLRDHRKTEVARKLNMPWSTFCDHCDRLQEVFKRKLHEYL